MSAQIQLSELPPAKCNQLVRGTLWAVKRWFEDPTHWAEYAGWYEKKYGRPPEKGYGRPKV